MTKTMKYIRTGSILFLAMLLMLVSLPMYTVSTAAAGKVVYVAADGSDDSKGLSQDDPMSFAKANLTVFNGGDTVLFKRGDTFYGQFDPLINNTSNASRVEVGAYGTGELPVISNVKIVSSAWTKASNGFYKFSLAKNGNYSGVNTDGWNVGFIVDAKGKKYYNLKMSASECTAQYDFYCSEGEKAIYIKSSTDPYAALGTLTLVMDGSLFRMDPGMTIHDLHLQYGAGHAMSWGSQYARSDCKYVTIYDCVIEDIGGAELNRSNGSLVRYGNGIELYNGGSNITIENNIIRNCYDVGFTAQGSGSDSVWRNVTVSNNIFAYNTQAIEIWSYATGSGVGVQLLTFANNLCINQGEGWGYDARPEVWQATDFLAYGYSPAMWRMTIENNTYYHSSSNIPVYCMVSDSLATFKKTVTANNNYFYQPDADSVVLCTRASGTCTYDTFTAWQTDYGKDANSTWTAIGNGSKYSNMEKLALTSTDFDTIAKAAKDAGLTMKLTFSTPTTTKTTTTASTTATTKSTVSTTANTGDNATTTTDGTATTVSDADTTEDNGSEETTTSASEQTNAGTEGKNMTWLFIVIGAVVLVAAGVTVTLIVLKKRKDTAE